jgi:hypothetical protein
MTSAGFPAITKLHPKLLLTNDSAPIIQFDPIRNSPIITELAPIETLSPMIGHPPPGYLWPIVTPFLKVTPRPNFVSPFITIPWPWKIARPGPIIVLGGISTDKIHSIKILYKTKNGTALILGFSEEPRQA